MIARNSESELGDIVEMGSLNGRPAGAKQAINFY
jgi:hypothetical protein